MGLELKKQQQNMQYGVLILLIVTEQALPLYIFFLKDLWNKLHLEWSLKPNWAEKYPQGSCDS